MRVTRRVQKRAAASTSWNAPRSVPAGKLRALGAMAPALLPNSPSNAGPGWPAARVETRRHVRRRVGDAEGEGMMAALSQLSITSSCLAHLHSRTGPASRSTAVQHALPRDRTVDVYSGRDRSRAMPRDRARAPPASAEPVRIEGPRPPVGQPPMAGASDAAGTCGQTPTKE